MIDKLIERITYVWITKQIMPRPSGDMAEGPTLEVIVHPRLGLGWTTNPQVDHSAMTPSALFVYCICIYDNL